MNNLSPKFSFNRVQTVFLWLFAANKSKLIKMLVIASSTTFFFVIITKMWNLPDDIISSVMGLAFFVATSILASNYLEPAIDNKNNRLQFLSMPALRKEKSLAAMALLIVKIIALVVVIDILSLLFNLIGDCQIGLILPYLHSCDNMMQFWFGISFLLAFWALNMVLGLVYPKCGFIFIFCVGGSFLQKMVERLPSVMESHSLLSLFQQNWIGYTGIIICSVVFLLCFIGALYAGKYPLHNKITLIDYNPISIFLRKH
ncbi:MAG: hypothetical protein J5826_04910 [Bacteroidales bacterium]|nr:hypothetical protein [Bacteroidales bacterium]